MRTAFIDIKRFEAQRTREQSSMTQREIIQTLLAKEIPERVGLNEHFWPHIVPNAWGEQGIEKDTDFGEHFNLDLKNVNWFFAPGPRPDMACVVEESDEWIVRRDSWGASFKNWKHKSGTPEHVAFSVTSPEIWKQEFRDAFEAIDVRTNIDVEQMRIRYAKAKASDKFITYSGLFVFEELRKIMGDVTMLESLLLEPEWIHDFCGAITRKNMAHYEFLFTEIGLPDGLHIYEDLGYTAAPFASPACHRELVLPYHKQLFSLFKDYNLPIILHTCGDFRPHIDSIIESGVDCIQALEAKTGMDVVEMAESYKDKLCFMGNIDIRALESGNRETIKAECLGKLNGMKALRAPYIYMSDHSLPPTVSVSDYEYMLELYHENCRY
jgi:uroporphyrinogen decarboxylase